jgi:hypothetical protein
LVEEAKTFVGAVDDEAGAAGEEDDGVEAKNKHVEGRDGLESRRVRG